MISGVARVSEAQFYAVAIPLPMAQPDIKNRVGALRGGGRSYGSGRFPFADLLPAIGRPGPRHKEICDLGGKVAEVSLLLSRTATRYGVSVLGPGFNVLQTTELVATRSHKQGEDLQSACLHSFKQHRDFLISDELRVQEVCGYQQYGDLGAVKSLADFPRPFVPRLQMLVAPRLYQAFLLEHTQMHKKPREPFSVVVAVTDEDA